MQPYEEIEMEVAPVSVVKQAARDFAAALAETEAYRAFEQAARQLQTDPAAQQAVQAFQSKQQSLQMMIMLNAVSQEDRAELERLHQAMLAQPAVASYFKSQGQLTALCQVIGVQLSERIGIDYAAACGVSCCG